MIALLALILAVLPVSAHAADITKTVGQTGSLSIGSWYSGYELTYSEWRVSDSSVLSFTYKGQKECGYVCRKAGTCTVYWDWVVAYSAGYNYDVQNGTETWVIKVTNGSASTPTPTPKPTPVLTPTPKPTPTPVPTPTPTSGSCGASARWAYSAAEKTLSITGTGAMDDFSQAPWKAWSSGIEKVTVGSGITRIGSHSFDGCARLTSASLPNSVTGIGPYAFYGCERLKNCAIPSDVTSIGSYAFCKCTGLDALTLPTGLTDIEHGLCSNCSSLKRISIPSGITSIGRYAFYGCGSLASVSLPSGLTSIGYYAFQNCTALSGISLPKGLTSISDSAFDGCAGLTRLDLPTACKIGSYAFQGCTGVSKLFIPKDTTIEGREIFENMTGLKSLTIEEGTTEFGRYLQSDNSYYSCPGLFSGCTALSYVHFPSTLTRLGDECFKGCTALKRVDLPRGMIELGPRAFDGCTALKIVHVPSGNIYDAFANCSSLEVLSIAKQTKYYSNDISNFSTILPNVKQFYYGGTREEYDRFWGDVADAYLTNATKHFSDSLPDAVNATPVILPDSLRTLEREAFYGDKTLVHVIFPSSLKAIPASAFAQCVNLAVVEIPASVTSIDSTAFSGCPSSMLIIAPAGSAAAAFATQHGFDLLPV